MQQLGGNQGVQGVPSICTIHLKIFSEKFPTCKGPKAFATGNVVAAMQNLRRRPVERL